MDEIVLNDQSEVSKTLVFPLYLRARESQRSDALIKDDRAVALIEKISYDFSKFKYEDHDQVGIVLRTRKIDRHAQDFLTRHPDGVVVHIGCGLDFRFERVDNGQVEWYDLDFPTVIKLRQGISSEEGERHHLLGCSVLENAWMETLSVHRPRPFLFIAEGVFVYFEEAQVKSLFMNIKDHFPGAELVFDMSSPLIVWLNNLRTSRIRSGIRYHWGMKRAKDLESWGEDIHLLDEWYIFDESVPRLGASHRWMRNIPQLAKSLGIIHIQLGKASA